MYKTYLTILFLILVLSFSVFLILGQPPFSTGTIDYYCERTDASFWSEPVNALTNLSFIIAGVGAILLLRKRSLKSLHIWVLAGLMFFIGSGSFLFHTLATHITELADILPIFAFQLIFLWSYPRFALGFGYLKTGALVALYLLLTTLSSLIPFDLNGSQHYIPAALMLGLYAQMSLNQARYGVTLLVIATILFAVALTARTVDEWLCPWWPMGTHFLWHLLNGGVIYLSWVSLYRAELRRNTL